MSRRHADMLSPSIDAAVASNSRMTSATASGFHSAALPSRFSLTSVANVPVPAKIIGQPDAMDASAFAGLVSLATSTGLIDANPARAPR
ncbi:hypothetical protein NOCARDAX2BIS_80035 [Nocardioides sp. AX2bis]|nr:hypothetical protein NOCARDAX2BIS_80035 [Nocardioides sp. AX2bis]